MEETEPVPTRPLINYVVGFLLIGLAWGFTTPFIRRAAVHHKPPPHPILETPSIQNSWIKSKVYGAFFGVTDLLRNWRYALPLVINLTGSVWFFLLIGQAELSLTVPITNSLAFLFTVLGEWWVEKKVICRGEFSIVFFSTNY
ncbi:hypothetical protein HYFRA_00007081 [Hymenoscyphus fraxineus]|uniref:Integral membrane protein n=1 Tax=Hymenoscyphus fraxineus TaxID=746836 RepID=A0A9N9KZZ0_9HELO|nr:hypothetical protein HYFRA_00007081 [Hymenoscyphus fraxineus]